MAKPGEDKISTDIMSMEVRDWIIREDSLEEIPISTPPPRDIRYEGYIVHNISYTIYRYNQLGEFHCYKLHQ